MSLRWPMRLCFCYFTKSQKNTHTYDIKDTNRSLLFQYPNVQRYAVCSVINFLRFVYFRGRWRRRSRGELSQTLSIVSASPVNFQLISSCVFQWFKLDSQVLECGAAGQSVRGGFLFGYKVSVNDSISTVRRRNGEMWGPYPVEFIFCEWRSGRKY